MWNTRDLNIWLSLYILCSIEFIRKLVNSMVLIMLIRKRTQLTIIISIEIAIIKSSSLDSIFTNSISFKGWFGLYFLFSLKHVFKYSWITFLKTFIFGFMKIYTCTKQEYVIYKYYSKRKCQMVGSLLILVNYTLWKVMKGNYFMQKKNGCMN